MPPAITLETFRDGPLGSILFGGPGGPDVELFFRLLVSPGRSRRSWPTAVTSSSNPTSAFKGATLHVTLDRHARRGGLPPAIDPRRSSSSRSIGYSTQGSGRRALPGQTVRSSESAGPRGQSRPSLPTGRRVWVRAPPGFTKVESFERTGERDRIRRFTSSSASPPPTSRSLSSTVRTRPRTHLQGRPLPARSS